MSDPTFSILLPIVRPPCFLPFAVESVLRQERPDFELFIVCDGAPDETVRWAEDAARRDKRIRVFAFTKGERHGEAHRHAALGQARGRHVCQIADDDLWLPDHLTEMQRLLDKVEFGNLTPLVVAANGSHRIIIKTLADQRVVRLMRTKRWNFFGPHVAGYRLAAYRRLPVGWSPAPSDIYTDLHMWRKFLTLPGLTYGSRFAVTSVHFPQSLRVGWPAQRRAEEIASVAGLLASPEGRDRFIQQAVQNTAKYLQRLSIEHGAHLKAITDLEARLAAAEARARELESGLAASRAEQHRLEPKLSAADGERDRPAERVE